MTDHTPTPWSLCGDGACSCLTLGCPDHPIAKVQSGEWGDEYPAMRQVGPSLDNRYEAYMERIGYGAIDPEVARANARFIQKAVNNHDALVKALEEIANCSSIPITVAKAALAAITQSAPLRAGSLPSGESDPSVMLDCGGADTKESVQAEVDYFEEHADRFAAAHKGIATVSDMTKLRTTRE